MAPPRAPEWEPPPERPLPENGQGEFFFKEAFSGTLADSFLEIVPKSAESHLLVKVEQWQGSQIVCWFLVRQGAPSAKTDIPPGTYRLKFAWGQHWYGPEVLFGPNASYSAVTTPVTVPEHTYYTINLTPNFLGTLRETPLRPSEF